MTLTLRVEEPGVGASDTSGTLTLKKGSATIGRGSQNDLVLPDPQRMISKQHCMIECIDGRYRVTDTSTNGIFLNQSKKPVGRGKHAYLNDGDRLRIAHYELGVSVSEDPAAVPLGPSAASARRPSLSDTHDMPGRREDLDRMIGLGDRAEAGAPQDYGPRPIIPDDSDSWQSPHAREPLPMAGLHTSPEREFFQPPKVVEEIPEDWHAEIEPESRGADLLTDTAELTPRAAEPEIPEIPEIPEVPEVPEVPELTGAGAADPSPGEPATLRPVPPAQPQRTADRSASEQAALQAFLAGANLGDLHIPDEQAAEMMHLLGQMYREVVTGLMEVLAARSSIKNEFRLSQTIIQPAQNNPLKFSLGADDAMAALLVRRGRNYLPPVQAVREAIGDIKAHQVAVLAGMQIALGELLRRFDPAALEERMRKERGLASLLSVKKARYWDAFGQLYQDLIVEAEDDFHNLFGKEFKRAYEEQVRKLDKR